MGRYNNVMTLLNTASTYNLDDLVKLLWDEVLSSRFPQEDAIEELAEDIAFVLISLWGMTRPETRTEFINRLTDEIVNVEIKDMFNDE